MERRSISEDGTFQSGGPTVESNGVRTFVPREYRLPGEDVNAAYAVFASGPFFSCGPEAIEPMRDAHFVEPDPPKNLDQLCLRQSAGNSTRP
jgi:hypothetical protein